MFQEHLPYADHSNAVTPMSEENGAIIVPVSYANFGSRHSSYTSHTSRITYTSHADLFKPPMTKERQLRSRSARNYFNPSDQRYYRDVRHPDSFYSSASKYTDIFKREWNDITHTHNDTILILTDRIGFQEDYDSSSISKSKQQVDECGYNDSQKHTVVDMRGKLVVSE